MAEGPKGGGGLPDSPPEQAAAPGPAPASALPGGAAPAGADPGRAVPDGARPVGPAPGASAAGKGRAGEAAAALVLEAEGYRLLARNFRGPAGEIDIVALRGDTIAFVEVKSWSALGLEDLADSIGARKRRRIVETSKIFLARNRQYSSMRARYDVLLMRDGIVARRIESAFTGDL